MGTTTHGLPYPDDDDLVIDGADAVRSLAEAVDDLVTADAGWTALPLAAGWVDPLIGNAPPRYRKDAGGFVHLEGRVKHSTGGEASADPVATLPAGYRPSGTTRHVVYINGAAIGLLLITAAGVITTNGGVDGASLDGVTFHAAA